MTTKFSLRQFKRKYGTHQMCLEAIKELKYPIGTKCPKCKESSVFYPVTDRTAYACKLCGWHVYPLASTVFEKSTTPLDLWFFAMYLMVQTRAGISAKQLERMLGVTYKTAWRMFKQIRILMAESGGGKASNRKDRYGMGSVDKEVVMGMVQRGGKVYMKHVPNTGKWTLINQVRLNVSPKAKVFTDEFGSYLSLPKFGYHHESVVHSASQYVKGEVHTQNIENV